MDVRILWRLIALTASIGTGSASAQASDLDVCSDARGASKVAACTRVIASGQLGRSQLPIAYNLRGVGYGQMDDYDRAIADYSTAIRLDPKNSFPYNNRGNAYRAKDDPDRAIADFSSAIRLNPKAASLPYNGRGLAYDDKGDFTRALADFGEAIRINPKNAIAYSNRGVTWNHKLEFDRATADFNEAIRLDPNNDVNWSNRCSNWYDAGDFDRALADCNEAIRLNPKNGDAYVGRSNVRIDKGEFDRAIADLTQALKVNPKAANAHINLGNIWGEKGDLDRSIAEYDQAIQLTPRSDKAYSLRGERWRQKGDLDRSISDLDMAIRLGNLTRINPLTFTLRGETLRYKGDFQRALADFNEALRQIPDFVSAYVGRGLTFEKMGDLKAAREDFEKALTLEPKANQGRPVKAAQDTARARIAALDSGVAQPSITLVPAVAPKPNSLPTRPPAMPEASPAVAPQGRRVALVIGNSSYKNVPALANPHNDAEAIAASLRKIGFHSVKLANDTTRENLVNSLRAFAEEAETADWAVVYYAGHGIELNGQNYLIPVDARLAADRDVQFETVPLGQVLAALEGAKKLRMVLLDACRVNPFKQQMRQTEAVTAAAALDSASSGGAGTRSVGRGLARVEVRAGPTLVVFAAKDGQTALDGDGPNSPFAIAMVQRIATPGVEINKIFRLVRDDVMEATAGRQEPYTYGSLPGREDFFFVTK